MSCVVFCGDEIFFGHVIFAIIARIFCENLLKAKQQFADFQENIISRTIEERGMAGMAQ